HRLARLVEFRRQDAGDVHQRLAEGPAEGVEHREFDGTPGRIPLDQAVVAGDGDELQLLGGVDYLKKVIAGGKLACQVAALEQVDGEDDGFAGDVVARHALAEADRAIRERAAND